MFLFFILFVAFFGAYFYFANLLIDASSVVKILEQTTQKARKDIGSLEEILTDLRQTYPIIITLISTSAAFTFIWILLLKYNARIIVWTSLLFIPTLLSTCLYFSVTTSIDLHNKQDEIEMVDVNPSEYQAIQTIVTAELVSYAKNETLWILVSVILAIALLVSVILVYSLRQRIRLSVALIRQASKAINGVKSTLIFPILPRAISISMILYGLLVALLIINAGHSQYKFVGGPNHGQLCNQKKINSSLSSVEPNRRLDGHPVWPSDETINRLPPRSINSEKNSSFSHQDNRPICVKQKNIIPKEHIWKCHAFNLFAILWFTHFISALTQTTLAGAFASYYWAPKKPDDIPFFAITQSFARVVKNHLGDIAFGSFLMATVRYIRIIIEFIANRFRKKTSSTVTQTVLNAQEPAKMLCLFRAIFWILDRFLKYIDRNAYIMMSMYGDGYLGSAKRAIKLLYKNSTRALVLDFVTYFVLLASRLMVTCLFTYIAFQYLDAPKQYKWLPVVLVAFGAYFVSKGLFNVYCMAVDTLFICFLIDSDHNDGSIEKPYFMSKDLRRILRKNMKPLE